MDEKTTTAFQELQRIFGENNVTQETHENETVYYLNADILKQLTDIGKNEFIEQFLLNTNLSKSQIYALDDPMLLAVSKINIEKAANIENLKNAQLSSFSPSALDDVPAESLSDAAKTAPLPLPSDSPTKKWLEEIFGAENIKESYINKQTGNAPAGSASDENRKIYYVDTESTKLLQNNNRLKHLRDRTLNSLIHTIMKNVIDSDHDKHGNIVVEQNHTKGLISFYTDEFNQITEKELNSIKEKLKDRKSLQEHIVTLAEETHKKETNQFKIVYERVEQDPHSYDKIHLLDKPIEKFYFDSTQNPKPASHHRTSATLKKLFGMRFTQMEDGMYRSTTPIKSAKAKTLQIQELLGLDAEQCCVKTKQDKYTSVDYIDINAQAALDAFQAMTSGREFIDKHISVDQNNPQKTEVNYDAFYTDTYVKDAMQQKLRSIMNSDNERIR
jgi:hypothetical protein